VNADTWYYNLLNKEQKQVYYAIQKGLQGAEASFRVPSVEPETLSLCYTYVRLDHPELFYAPSFRYAFREGAETAEVLPEYLFQKKQLEEQRNAMEARVKRVIAPAEKLPPEEKLLYIHDFICKSVHYDKLKKAYSHEIFGALGQGVAVCEGIAKTVKLLCGRLKLPCIVAMAENNPGKGIRYRHAWNVVELEGKTYHLDATFDNSLGSPEEIRYDYFLLPDSRLFRDHEPLVWPVPPCSEGKRAYYEAKKLSFTSEEEVRKRVAQYAKKEKTLTFRWRGDYLTRSRLEALVGWIEAAAEERGKEPNISLNWPQAVLTVRFTAAGKASLLLQQANEGEELAPAAPDEEPIS